MHKRSRGYQAESIVIEYYTTQGYTLAQRNFTIRGGEIDIIVEKEGVLVFIEVKDVTYMDDISNYLTATKKKTLLHTIKTYLYTNPSYLSIRIDVVFVKKEQLYHIVENCIDFY